MNIKKISLVKKNFYLAIVVVVLLFVIGFVIAQYDATKASHETLYTNRIEPKTGSDVNVVGNLLVNGQPFGPWAVSGSNIYYNTGNVGIGTTSPQAKLEVKGSSIDGVLFQINDTFDALMSLIEPVFVIHNNRFGRRLEITSGGYIFQYDGGIKNLFRSDGDSFITGGNVGIGTRSPQAPAPNGQSGNLDVNDIYLRSVGRWTSELLPTVKWYNVKAQRAENVKYVNNRNYPIELAVASTEADGLGVAYCYLEIRIDGDTIILQRNNNPEWNKVCSAAVTVPAGSTYQVIVDDYRNGKIMYWHELY